MRTPAPPAKHPRWFSLFVVAATLLLASSASAAQVVVVVGGDADAETRQQLSAAVVQGLREQRTEHGERKLRPADVDAMIRCVSAEASQACAAQFMETNQANRAVVMRVVRETRRRTTTIYGWVVARAGTILVVHQRVCEDCATAQLAQSARALLGDLFKGVETATMPSTLSVRTLPPGAQVELDGRIVGVTPLDHVVVAGPHRIVLHLRGHETSIQEREVLAGETTTIDATLTPTAPTKQPRTPSEATSIDRPFAWKPWAVVGAGATLSLAGVGLWLLDEDGDPSRPRYEHRETTWLALGTGATGAAVGAVGVFWLLRSKNERGPVKARAPSVVIAPSGAMLVYGGAF